MMSEVDFCPFFNRRHVYFSDIPLFELDRCRRFAGAIVEHAVHMLDFIDDAAGDSAQNIPRHIVALRRHKVGEGILHHAEGVDLIPVQAQYLSAKGLEQLLQTIQKVRRQINPKLKIEGILMTMTDSRTNYGREIDALIRQVYGSKIRVFEQPVPHSVRAAEISAEGRSIFAHDPKGKVAAAYQSLTREVLDDAEKQRKLGAERSR